jgi:acetolactate synthase-1/2/3 large subunit
MKKRVADIIIETLVELGVKDCFSVVGGGSMHLDNALGLNDDMNVVFHHHEQACAMAAEGYAKTSGNIAAVCVTSGPGATNTLTGVMGAWVDSVPMFVMSGQIRYEVSVAKTGLPLRFRGNQEFDIIGSVKNMTKYAKMVTDPLSIKNEINKAVKTAISGRRGPVWLDIPLDIQNAMVNEEDLYPVEEIKEEPTIKEEEFNNLIEMISNAKRPVIIGGNGIANSGNLGLFREFAKKLGIPVVASAIAADVLYDDYDLYYGISGFIGPRTGNFILQNADFILTLGTSLGFKTTGYTQEKFAVNAKIVMVDCDEYEVRKPGVRVDYFIHSELKNFFNYCLPKIKHVNVPNEWIDYCNKLKNRFTPFEATEGLSADVRVCSYMFWKKFEEHEPDDSIAALGNNTGISSKLQIGIKHENSRVIANNNCGSMGYDLPAAIGSAVASKKEVICVTGDGSIMMNLQELQTIKHYNLPVKVVIFSNDGYNAFRQTCKNFFNGFNVGCDAESGVSFPSFEKVADTFGYGYKCCHSNGELDECLDWLFSQEGQVILEVEQRLDDPITPKVMSRINDKGEFVTPSIEDMYPFIDEEEYKSLMIGDING